MTQLLTLRDNDSTTWTGTVSVDSSGPPLPVTPPPDHVTCHVTVALTAKAPPGWLFDVRV
jgi:hypothetical protein